MGHIHNIKLKMDSPLISTQYSEFPLQNIPFGIAKFKEKNHCVSRIGRFIIDLFEIWTQGLFPKWGLCFACESLNSFMSLGRVKWICCRYILQSYFKLQGLLFENMR